MTAKLNQSFPRCSDFEVSFEEQSSPAFRVLLPEHVVADELVFSENRAFFHTIPGKWTQTSDGMDGTFSLNSFEVSVSITTCDTSIHTHLGVKNISSELRTNVRADFCTSVNHMPCEKPWSNRSFIPREIDEDRDQQGRHWFDHVTPDRLRALGEQGWIHMHPSQSKLLETPPPPSEAAKPPAQFHGFEPSKGDKACACAVQSLDGRTLLFQVWDRPCVYCTPSTQNACMHMRPPLADRLEPGQSAQLYGITGLFSGSWEELALWLKQKNHHLASLC